MINVIGTNVLNLQIDQKKCNKISLYLFKILIAVNIGKCLLPIEFIIKSDNKNKHCKTKFLGAFGRCVVCISKYHSLNMPL